MTIRDFVSLFDTKCCVRVQIIDGKNNALSLFIAWDERDLDFQAFDMLAYMTIDRWYVTLDGVIRIYTYEPFSPEEIDALHDKGFWD